jgi:hypothetical protein
LSVVSSAPKAGVTSPPGTEPKHPGTRNLNVEPRNPNPGTPAPRNPDSIYATDPAR